MNEQTEVILSVIAYSFCSGSLVLINKLILHHLPFPSLVVTVQLWATISFIYSLHYCCNVINIDPIKWKHVAPYLVYTVAFSLGVFCNMKSLTLSNVETVIVFRALAPVLVSVLDVAFLGREWPSLRSWSALALIVAGAYGYAATDEQFINQGLHAYLWPTLYLFTISFEMAYGKNIVKSVELKTRSGPVQYTNLLGWPPMLIFAQMTGEYDKLNVAWLEDGMAMFTSSSLALLLLGCIIGTGIGYSGWWCRSKVSATTYTIIGVMNKCLTVLVNCLIWDQHAGAAGIASLFLCLIGGAMYQQAPMRKEGMKNEDISSSKALESNEDRAHLSDDEEKALLSEQDKGGSDKESEGKGSDDESNGVDKDSDNLHQRRHGSLVDKEKGTTFV